MSRAAARNLGMLKQVNRKGGKLESKRKSGF